jgi:hypothetical protein
MRFHLPLVPLLLGICVAAVPLEASAQRYYSGRQAGARIWVDNDRDFYRRGDRVDVRFTLSDDAYVAIVHVDPEGYLDFVYPASPWDNEYVRRGRVHTLPFRGGSSWRVGDHSGIGYFYLIASRSPLEFSNFRGRSGSPWDWGYAGRVVRGDPFLAFQQISDLLLPWPSTPYVYDYYGYHVGGIHRYPSYACSDDFYGNGWGWSPSYGSCSRMDYFLGDYPNYYDTRRYRGDRRSNLGRYDRLDPLHGFKEDPERPAARGVAPRPQPDRRQGITTDGSANDRPSGSVGDVERRDPVAPRAAPPPTREPERQGTSRTREPAARPTPERTREPAARSAPERPAANQGTGSRARPEPSSGSRRAAPEPSAPANSSGRRPAVDQP